MGTLSNQNHALENIAEAVEHVADALGLGSITSHMDYLIFKAYLDRFRITNHEDIEFLTAVHTDEDALNKMILSIVPCETKVLFATCKETKIFGYTEPIFSDSNINPSSHMIVLSHCSHFVLAHELAHVLDFEDCKQRKLKGGDAHDDIFMKLWEDLLFKMLKHKERR